MLEQVFDLWLTAVGLFVIIGPIALLAKWLHRAGHRTCVMEFKHLARSCGTTAQRLSPNDFNFFIQSAEVTVEVRGEIRYLRGPSLLVELWIKLPVTVPPFEVKVVPHSLRNSNGLVLRQVPEFDEIYFIEAESPPHLVAFLSPWVQTRLVELAGRWASGSLRCTGEAMRFSPGVALQGAGLAKSIELLVLFHRTAAHLGLQAATPGHHTATSTAPA